MVTINPDSGHLNATQGQYTNAVCMEMLVTPSPRIASIQDEHITERPVPPCSLSSACKTDLLQPTTTIAKQMVPQEENRLIGQQPSEG